LAEALHYGPAVTRFDRHWEPYVVVIVALILLFGTRC
jgi:hypothetical protein